MRYAENTSVSSDKSRAEIEKTLIRYGAGGFLYGWQQQQAMVMFEMQGRSIRFLLPLPEKTDPEFTQTPRRGRRRTEAQAYEAWEQSCRQRWRALALCIKAKLEAVESGITTFEHEFLAHFITADGRTIGDHIIPQLTDKNITSRLTLIMDGRH
jgi:hypothetical protein